jgi:hypothetical protein
MVSSDEDQMEMMVESAGMHLVEIHLNSHLQMMNELKMASRETIPLSHECSPLLGGFFCVKNDNKNCLLDKLSQSFSDIFHNSFT